MRHGPAAPISTLWAQALAAPLLAALRPRVAGQWLLAAPRPAWVATILVYLLLYAALVIGMALWEDMGQHPVFSRTWSRWTARGHEPIWLSSVDLIVLGVLAGGHALLVILAWLHLPLVHRTGPVRRSWTEAIRAAGALLGPALLGTLGCFLAYLAHHYAAVWLRTTGPEFVLFPSVAAGSAWFLYLSGRVIETVHSPAVLDLPPRCEGCGYDLTHRPASGHCTECGRPLGHSLIESYARPGSEWAAGHAPGAWLSTACEVIFRPTQFYGGLKVRGPLAADRSFATVNFVLLAALAGIWAAGLGGTLYWRDLARGRAGAIPPVGEIVLMGGGAVLFGTCACWLGQRVIAAVVFTTWLAQRALPDFGWAAKIVVYESAFVWAFVAYWGTLVTSFAFFETWISRICGAPFNGNLEALVVLGGSVMLGVIWLVRYLKALRAIRWANW